MYNLYNLEPKFKNFLHAENISSVSLRNYLSDLRHFIGWLATSNKYQENNSLAENISSLNSEIIEEYKDRHIKSGLPHKTINRRLSALRKFFLFCQKEGLLKENPAKKVSNVSLVKKSQIKKKSEKIHNENEAKAIFSLSRGPAEGEVRLSCDKNCVAEFSKLSLFKYFLTAFIIIFFIFVFSQNFSKKQYLTPIVQAIPTSKRYLAFDGKFFDGLGNPITTKTDVAFKLYNLPVGGKPLYTSACSGQDGAITPDVNGNVRVLIGSDCDGNPIPTKIFSENANLYLGVTVSADSEMKPRENIPNVGYAKNSDTIQGLSIGNQTSTVPYINENGDLLVAAANAGIRSTIESSNFSISSAETITVQSASMGDVILQATESGAIKLRTGGSSDSDIRMFINQMGKIGIGTLFPTYDFEVSGDVKVGDGSKLILGSSSYDPTGINGAIYFNTKLNKIRCFQNNVWTDCLGETEKSPIGGVYDGNIENEPWDIADFTSYFPSLTSNLQHLTSNFISVREKIISPIVETEQISTRELSTGEIKPRNEDLIVDLSNNNQASTSEVNVVNKNTSEVDNENKGPLASLIIKGLEGKTVAQIDATGNASFSGTITAEEIKSQKLKVKSVEAEQATLSGKLTAKEVEAENIKVIEDRLNVIASEAKQSQLNAIVTSSTSSPPRNDTELNNQINEIQKLLAEIKNQPLPDPRYYQNLENNQQLEQLTVTGSSNLYNLSVTGSGTIGNLLIQDNSILSLAWDLKLSALANIKLFDNAVVIGKDGTIQTKGKIIAEDGVKTNKIEPLTPDDKVTINNLAINNLAISDKYIFDENNISSPTIETKTASAGNAVIPAGSSELTIYNNNIKDNSLIYLTPTSATPSPSLTVSKKEVCNSTVEQLSNETIKQCKPYFKVAINSPTTNPLAFNWLILN